MIRKGARPFHPPANRDSFKDLLIFEERLKQNAERLQKQRRKYQGFLVSLVAVILYLAYLVLVHPSIYSLVHYSNVACLLVAATTLILFFATGMYSDKIAYAYKFVPQANRALRPFNIYLNTRHKSRFSFLLNPFRSSPSNTSRSNSIASPSLSRTPSGRSISSPTPSNSSSRDDLSSLSRQTSASSLRSQTSFRSTTALHSASPSPSVSPSSSPPSSPRPSTTPLPLPTSEGPVTRAPPVPSPPLSSSSSTRTPGIPIPPIPPAQNPRGELIFSNRVNPTFREGYERYRGEWERRRKENKELENRAKNSTWWWKLSNWGLKNVSPRTTHGEQGTVGKEQNEGKERGRNSAESSQFNSRANSSERQPSSTTTTTTNARTAAEALLSTTVSTPRTSSPNHSPRPASPSPVPSSTSLAPLDADDPSSTSTPPPQSAPHTLSPTTTNSTQSNGKGNSPNHSRIRAESFSELLELEAANEEENELGGVGGGGGVGPPELRRSSSFR